MFVVSLRYMNLNMAIVIKGGLVIANCDNVMFVSLVGSINVSDMTHATVSDC